MAAGLNATLSLAQINHDYGADIATIRNAFGRLQSRHATHWSATGAADFLALGGTQGDLDTLGSAITEMVNLNAVRLGLANVGADGSVNQGSGHNFDTFAARVSGDSVS